MELPSFIHRFWEKIKNIKKISRTPLFISAIVLLFSVILYFAIPKIGAKFPKQYEHVLSAKAKLFDFFLRTWKCLCYPFQILYQFFKKAFVKICVSIRQVAEGLYNNFHVLFTGISGLFKKLLSKIILFFASILPFLMKIMNILLRFFVMLSSMIKKGFIQVASWVSYAFGIIDGIYMNIFGKPLTFLFEVSSKFLLGLVDVLFFFPLFVVKSFAKLLFGFLLPMKNNLFDYLNNFCNDVSPCEIIQRERFTKIMQDINDQINITKEILGLIKESEK